MWEGSVWILMDPYGPVWVRMVHGDLFQRFPCPKPLKNIEQFWFWGVRGGGGHPLILTYMALWPAYVGVRVWVPYPPIVGARYWYVPLRASLHQRRQILWLVACA